MFTTSIARPDAGQFHFGLEAEYLLVDADSFRPLWHPDLSFDQLHDTLASIPLDGLPPLDGLKFEAPHRHLMPYVVEGYHIPDPDYNPIDLLPKGVEIRTPACSSVEQCLSCLNTLHARMQEALQPAGYQAVALSHHPIEHQFRGPQNKRRHDFWQWAMQVMVTFGADVNISLPADVNQRLDPEDLEAKVDYYGPALTALSVASPFYRNDLWRVGGSVGKSIRSYRRSVIAPAIELHPDQGGRMEFKLFEMSCAVADFHGYFLLWLALLLDDQLKGRASREDRVYDLGSVARFGIQAEAVESRAYEVLDGSAKTLESWGFNTQPLEIFRSRLASGRVPADDLIDHFKRTQSISEVLRTRAELKPEIPPSAVAHEGHSAELQEITAHRSGDAQE